MLRLCPNERIATETLQFHIIFGKNNNSKSNFNRNCREKSCIDSKKNVEHVLDVYTQMCNVTVNCDSLSVLAATLGKTKTLKIEIIFF